MLGTAGAAWTCGGTQRGEWPWCLWDYASAMSEPERFVTVDALPEDIDHVGEPPYAPYARIRSMIKPGDQLLDVGCGNGKLGAFFRRAGADVDGIEPADSRIDIARGRLRYVSDQWAGPAFHDEAIRSDYNLITFLDVVEHIPDPQPVLSWAADRLAPGGSICALIPNSAHWTFRAKMLRGDWDYSPGGGLFDRTHVRFFSPESAARLRPEGLEEVHRSYSGFGRSAPKPLIALRPRLFAIHTLFVWKKV
jgi:SAM-dependent methyltransferase